MTVKEYQEKLMDEFGGLYSIDRRPPDYKGNTFNSLHDHYHAWEAYGIPTLDIIAQLKRHVVEHGHEGPLTMLMRGNPWLVGASGRKLWQDMQKWQKQWADPQPDYVGIICLGMSVVDPGPEWDPHYIAVVSNFDDYQSLPRDGEACVAYLNGPNWQNIVPVEGWEPVVWPNLDYPRKWVPA